jgi:Ser/Thr protein kinase RdoA (MazF antagonist)
MDDVFAVLDHYAIDERSARFESLGSAGGMSGAQFWRVHAPRGPLCLRCWPKEHPSPKRLAFIHSVLRHAESRGIEFLPVPIRSNDDETFVQHGGNLWELSTWLPGKADYEQSPSDAKLKAAMTAMGKFHIATSDLPPSASAPEQMGTRISDPPEAHTDAIQNRYRRLGELSRGSATGHSKAIDDAIWPELAPLARQFLSSLHDSLPSVVAMLQPLQTVTLPLQPCIRDIWHDHILFSGDVVTGIVDFGAIGFDTPACDIARLLGSLVGDDANGWQKGLAAYGVVRRLSVEESAAVRALDASGTLLAGCNWIRWIYMEGREFENREQVVERFRRILARTLNLVTAK